VGINCKCHSHFQRPHRPFAWPQFESCPTDRPRWHSGQTFNLTFNKENGANPQLRSRGPPPAVDRRCAVLGAVPPTITTQTCHSSLSFTPLFYSSFPSPRLNLRVRVSASPSTIDASRNFRLTWTFHNNNTTLPSCHIIRAWALYRETQHNPPHVPPFEPTDEMREFNPFALPSRMCRCIGSFRKTLAVG
jgi:hypothetical protein